MTDPSILRLEAVNKSFGGLDVVSNVSFDVPRGSSVALIGPNGAGKTTVFNLVSGVYPLSSGRVILDGEDVSALPSHKRPAFGLARSFQNIRLMPHLSVVENVMLGQHVRVTSMAGLLAPLWSRPKSRWRQDAENRLEQFQMADYCDESVSSLPYGIRKKIEIVRALMGNPKLLLLDEPAAGLNPRETAELDGFLAKIRANGVTLLVVEHDMALVRRLCGHAIVLNFGCKIYDGPTAQVQDDPTVLEAYLGRAHKGEKRERERPKPVAQNVA